MGKAGIFRKDFFVEFLNYFSEFTEIYFSYFFYNQVFFEFKITSRSASVRKINMVLKKIVNNFGTFWVTITKFKLLKKTLIL